MMAGDLPTGWTPAAIGDLSERAEQRTPSPDEHFVYIDIGSIDRDTKRIVSPQLVDGKSAPSRARQVVRARDVLVSMTRPNLNAVALVPEELDGEIASTGFDVLRPKEVDPRWLFGIVRTPDFVSAMSELVQGALYPAVRPRDVRAFEAPLAPLNEQKRIADKLDAILARVDGCRERLDRIPGILKRFRQSVLAAATSGELTADWREERGLPDSRQLIPYGDDSLEVPGHWEVLPLKEAINPARPLCYGVVQPGEERTGGVPLIRVQDLIGGTVDVGKLRTISAEIDGQYGRSRVVSGDLLISVVGTIGRTAVVPDGLEANIARAVSRIACRSGVDARWIDTWLSSTILQWWLLNSAREVARKTLNLAELGSTTVAIPPPDEQQEIVARVSTLFEHLDSLGLSFSQAVGRVERITPAALGKAFRGELVDQDPSDEPASVLLERIRAARRAESVAPAKRRRKLAMGRFEVLDEVEAPVPDVAEAAAGAN